MNLLLMALRIHAAQIVRGGLGQAEIDLSIREALRLRRRVAEIEAMEPERREYFEGHIPKKASACVHGTKCGCQ
jgi:hypothetical protein